MSEYKFNVTVEAARWKENQQSAKELEEVAGASLEWHQTLTQSVPYIKHVRVEYGDWVVRWSSNSISVMRDSEFQHLLAPNEGDAE